MKTLRTALAALIVLCAVVIGAVSLHSVEEIHYLKGFYPASFTVEEAFHAAAVEFIKVHLIVLPLMVVIALCAFVIWLLRGR